MVKGRIVPESGVETNSETLSSQEKRRKAEKEKQENILEGEKWLRADGNFNTLIVSGQVQSKERARKCSLFSRQPAKW